MMQPLPIDLKAFAAEVHANACEHGWWDTEREYPEIVALINSELSEALEEYRDERPMQYTGCRIMPGSCTPADYEGRICPERSLWDADDGIPCEHRSDKPQGIAAELADCVIRILDLCCKSKIDIAAAMKQAYEVINRAGAPLRSISPSQNAIYASEGKPLPIVVAYCQRDISVTLDFGINMRPAMLALCIARIQEYCGREGVDLVQTLRLKHEYNITRPHRHGGKLC